MPLFTGIRASPTALATGLSRVLFPVVLLLSLTGLFVAILQSYDEFSIPALAPAVWNVVIVVLLVVLHGRFKSHEDSVYAYAIAWLVATIVQFLMIAWALRRVEYSLSFAFDWRDPRVHQVLILFLPVTLTRRDHQPGHLHQRRLRSAGRQLRPRRHQRRVPALHAAPGDLQRRRRDGPVPDAEPDGVGARRRRDAAHAGQRDPPDQPAC